MKRFMDSQLLKLQVKAQHFLKDEGGAVDIVAIVVLIGIAVILAGIFKTGISGLINNLLTTITGSATNVVNNL